MRSVWALLSGAQRSGRGGRTNLFLSDYLQEMCKLSTRWSSALPSHVLQRTIEHKCLPTSDAEVAIKGFGE